MFWAYSHHVLINQLESTNEEGFFCFVFVFCSTVKNTLVFSCLHSFRNKTFHGLGKTAVTDLSLRDSWCTAPQSE